MEDEKTYRTEFINKRSERVIVQEFRKHFLILGPGETLALEAWDPKTTYAPFSKVTYLPEGRVEVRRNGDWENPYPDQWTIELVNTDGHDLELLQLEPGTGEFVVVYRGIPRVAPVSIISGEIFYRKIEWRFVKHKVRNPDNPDYLVTQIKLEKVKEVRSRRDLKKIRDTIAEAEKAKIDKAMDERFPAATAAEQES